MLLPQLSDAHLAGKTVFLRADFDVPMSLQTIDKRPQTTLADDSRLQASLPTLVYLLTHQAKKIILAGHLDRPQGKIISKLSTQPVASWLAQKLAENLGETPSKSGHRDYQIVKLPNYENVGLDAWGIGERLVVLENLRFHPGEEKNEPAFTQNLARLAELYVNEAFANSHRPHASMVSLPQLLPGFAGLHLQRETALLSKIITHPQRPLVVLIGGAKIETKFPLIEKMHLLADYVLLGGKIVEETRQLARVQHESIVGPRSELLVADLTPNHRDITMDSVELFRGPLNLAATLVWNGPMGVFEEEENEVGTRIIAEIIAGNHQAFKVVGGGDTLAAIDKYNLRDRMDWISTGGGAMLKYLVEGTLPALEALKRQNAF